MCASRGCQFRPSRKITKMAFVAPRDPVSYHSPFPPQSAPRQNSLKDHSTVTGASRSQIPNQLFFSFGGTTRATAPSDHTAGCRGFVGSMGHPSSDSLASDSARWLFGLKAFPICPSSTSFHSRCAMSSIHPPASYLDMRKDHLRSVNPGRYVSSRSSLLKSPSQVFRLGTR